MLRCFSHNNNPKMENSAYSGSSHDHGKHQFGTIYNGREGRRKEPRKVIFYQKLSFSSCQPPSNQTSHFSNTRKVHLISQRSRNLKEECGPHLILSPPGTEHLFPLSSLVNWLGTSSISSLAPPPRKTPNSNRPSLRRLPWLLSLCWNSSLIAMSNTWRTHKAPHRGDQGQLLPKLGKEQEPNTGHGTEQALKCLRSTWMNACNFLKCGFRFHKCLNNI